MTQHWTSVLAVDCYIVRMRGLLHDDDRKVLTQLYQPLMGAAAFSLYMTLWGEVERHSVWGKPATHHSLMSAMQLDLNQIFEQRKKLEGLSLLKVYVKNVPQAKEFLYELQAPLSARQFFQNDVLGIYLYNRVGRQRFELLKEQFSSAEIDESAYRQITSSFDEVYTSVHHSELVPDRQTQRALTIDDGQEWVGRGDSDGVQVSEASFDFDLLLSHLSGLIVPQEAVDGEVRDAIIKLAYVYDIDPLEMGKIIERVYYKQDGTIEIADLRKGVESWYALEYDNNAPSLSLRTQPAHYQTMAGREPQNQEEKLIRAFETYSPAEFLEESAGGAKPPSADLKVVERIMFEQKLPPGVVNVLIDYTMRKNNMKFTRAYAEKIAGQWARKNIKTVEDAMALGKEEYKSMQNGQQKQTRRKNTAPKKNTRKEPLPKWMNEKEPDISEEEWARKRRQLEERMKKYRNTP